MKIAITGHRRGLGRALSNKLSVDNEIVGLSISNGYNISNVNSILNQVENCDMFINNAYHEYFQCDLLLSLFTKWSNKNKIIVCIGSTVTDYPRIERNLDQYHWPYRDHKISLQKLFRHLVKQEHLCQMLLVNPGAIDTDMIAHLPGPKMKPATVAEIIVATIDNPLIKEITLYE